jgi:hypothetical protein
MEVVRCFCDFIVFCKTSRIIFATYFDCAFNFMGNRSDILRRARITCKVLAARHVQVEDEAFDLYSRRKRVTERQKQRK